MSKVTTREIQLKELEILKAVVEVCERNHIRYYLSSGTLLGAARHQGFIPWDDDIDIMMPYADYCRFLEIGQKELGDAFFLQTNDTDPNWYRPHAKVRMNGTAMFEKDLRSYHIHQGVWIDIFILTGINSELEFKVKQKIITICNYIQMDDYFQANDIAVMENAVGKTGIKVLKVIFRIPLPVRSWLHDILMGMVVNSKNKKYLTELWSNMTKLYDADIFAGEEKKLPFEGELFSVPQKWKDYLETTYGDYMTLPPEEQRVTHSPSIVDLENDYSVYME